MDILVPVNIGADSLYTRMLLPKQNDNFDSTLARKLQFIRIAIWALSRFSDCLEQCPRIAICPHAAYNYVKDLSHR